MNKIVEDFSTQYPRRRSLRLTRFLPMTELYKMADQVMVDVDQGHQPGEDHGYLQVHLQRRR